MNNHLMEFERGKEYFGLGPEAEEKLKKLDSNAKVVFKEERYLVSSKNNVVDLTNKGLTNEGLKKIFKHQYIVKGNFNIDGNNLTSLEGCPTEVHGSFSCTGNPLKSLKGLPEVIKGNVWIV